MDESFLSLAGGGGTSEAEMTDVEVFPAVCLEGARIALTPHPPCNRRVEKAICGSQVTERLLPLCFELPFRYSLCYSSPACANLLAS